MHILYTHSNMKKIRAPGVHVRGVGIALQSFLEPFSQIEQYLERFSTFIAEEEGIDLIGNFVLVIGLQQFLIHALFLTDERDEAHHLLHSLNPLKLNRKRPTFFLT